MRDHKLIVCAIVSVVGHFALAHGLEQLPERERKRRTPVVVKVIDAPRPPEPSKPPEPEPPPPEPTPVPTAKQPVQQAPRQRTFKTQVVAVPQDSPPSDIPAVSVTSSGDDEPVFGVSMQSTSPGGSTAAPVGNTTSPGGSGTPTGRPAAAAPVAAHETTKMPIPQGQCYGKYTEQAKTEGIEGTVVLDLTVGDDGRVREVQVVQGLSHGLSEAATKALRECRFSPGEKDGKNVAVRIRGFKIHFVLQEAR